MSDFDGVGAGDLMTLEECAAEIGRLVDRTAELEARLEIDPDHPFDGIECRDQTIRALEAQIEELKKPTARDATIRKAYQRINELEEKNKQLDISNRMLANEIEMLKAERRALISA